MIYINQIGYCELGRGENLDEALLNAQLSGFSCRYDDLRKYDEIREIEFNDCDVVYTDAKMEGYND